MAPPIALCAGAQTVQHSSDSVPLCAGALCAGALCAGALCAGAQ